MVDNKWGSILAIVILVLVMLIVPSNPLFLESARGTDYDPLFDQALDIHIKRVRKILGDTTPAFSLGITLEGTRWESEIFEGGDLIDVCSVSLDIPDTVAEIPVIFEIWEDTTKGDISPSGKSLNLVFDVIRGGWYGEDFRKDSSGYGHASGAEDGHTGITDYEIWFDITLQDADNDGLTYWEEQHIYHTDPGINDRNSDSDNDSIPLWWEDYWGYDPFSPDAHMTLDPDRDGLQNYEEYLMNEWFADPYTPNIYIEIDWMESPGGQNFHMPEPSLQLLYSQFSAHGIILLCDTGSMGGSEHLPYNKTLSWNSFQEIYTTYFLHNNENHTRKGIFRYAILCDSVNRVFFRSVGGMLFKRDAFVIASGYIQRWRPGETKSIISHASLFMHELGHCLGLNGYLGIDNPKTRFPWNLQYYLLGNYKSCMNYRYAFQLIDYSNGTHGFLDHDDWGTLNLQRFEE